MRSFLKISFVFCCVIFSVQSYAWNAVGHMLVAHIAYDKLKPNARAKVDKMTADLAKEYPEIRDFDHVAPWLDTLRGQKIETFTRWHYIDMGFSDDGMPVKSLVNTDNAIWAMSKVMQVTKNDKANPYERARFLAFLVHITGDLHQPLHTVSRVSSLYPDGDQGGNLYTVRYQGKTVSLHKLWDEGAGAFALDSTPENIRLLARTITNAYPESSFGAQAKDLVPTNWVTEGMGLAKTSVYSAPEGQIVPSSYLENGKQVSEQQIALAGYRLANLLNMLL